MGRGSELQTIMTSEDETEFLAFAENLVDRLDKDSKYQYFLIKDDCRIQFLRSRIENGVLLSGRIAVGSLQGDKVKGAVKVYRQLQRWIKKHYFNKLTVKNINISDSKRPYNKVWLGPCAKRAAIESDIVLSQGQKAVVVFEIDEQS